VVELILLAKKKKEFQGIRSYVITNIERLRKKVDEVVADNDPDRGA